MKETKCSECGKKLFVRNPMSTNKCTDCKRKRLDESRKTRKRKTRKCSSCGKDIKRFRIVKGEIVCYRCFQKKTNIIQTGPRMSIEEATSKVYEVRRTSRVNGTLMPYALFPQILVGKKIKIEVVDDE